MRNASERNSHTYIVLNFEVTDAVLPEFARRAPAPRVLVPTAQLLAQLRLVDHFLRAASTTRPTSHKTEDVDPRYDIAFGHARGFLTTWNGIKTFNAILEVADAFGRAVYRKDPTEKLGFLLPKPIDENAPIPEVLW